MNDLISRDALLESMFPFGKKNPVDVYTIITSAPSIDRRMASNWISCKDELPDSNRNVLVAFKPYGGSYHKIIAYYQKDESRWFESYDNSEIQNVTHWMNLPESPKE